MDYECVLSHECWLGCPKTALRKRPWVQHKMNLGFMEEKYTVVKGHIFTKSHLHLAFLQSSSIETTLDIFQQSSEITGNYT